MFKPNLLCGSWTLLKVAETATSSHFRMKLDAMQSSFSFTQVLPISDTVKCHEIFESTYRLYKIILFFGCNGNSSILFKMSVNVSSSSDL